MRRRPNCSADLSDQVPDEPDGSLAFVDLALPVLEPDDLPLLRLSGGDGIVAGGPSPVGVYPRCAPFTLSPVLTTEPTTSRASQRPPVRCRAARTNSSLSFGSRSTSLLCTLCIQALTVLGAGSLVSPPKRARTGSNCSYRRWLIRLPPSRLRPKKSQQHRPDAEVGGRKARTDGAPESAREPLSLQVLADEFQAGMRRDLLPSPSVVHSAVDTAPQTCSAS